RVPAALSDRNKSHVHRQTDTPWSYQALGSFIISPVFTPVPFDPFRDFTHIAYLGGQPVALFANTDLPFRTLSDFVTYEKARRGAVTYATISIGSQTQLLNEQFQAQAGIKMTHVPYRGAG